MLIGIRFLYETTSAALSFSGVLPSTFCCLIYSTLTFSMRMFALRDIRLRLSRRTLFSARKNYFLFSF